MSALSGYAIRILEPPYENLGVEAFQVINPGKVLPATGTGSLFAVTGSVVLKSLVGVVSTAFSATAVHPTLGVTGSNAVISAAPASSLASIPVGTVLYPETGLGTALPVPPITPAVPTSTTPATNTSPQAASVTITGGTLSAVLVNGVQVGTTAGTYTVPAGQTISITYSVAPTWSWAQGKITDTSLGEVEISNTSITITTDATNTGAITWMLSYVPMFKKWQGSVAAA